ncbi:MAG: ATP-dependent nuclease [Sphingopyxis sp.]|uniref:ATP-dependent nuclease n=1 Tax=Sphingopyxis sp. TaxID=1908224 RepID=UPI003D6C8A7A
MGAIIKSVHIENFRSICSIDANLAQLAIFVGRNDCGKSNILRALNLFFNDQTNPGTDFSWADDYNFFAPVRARRAKEIVVRLEVALPATYHDTNGHVIIWTKKWREDGLWSEEYDYFGQRISNNRRGEEVRTDVQIPDKSNVHSLLRKIEFEYVPAIKDSDYFDDLRGRIYGIISEVAARTFHESSAAFEHSIGEHLNELTASISESLALDTRLALPRDLYHIFERLDFLSGEMAVSLNNRGDGVKARHIPLILNFMARKKAQLQRRGGPPISSIWAYEEPENNLEIASAVQLADELHALAQEGVAQILLTTHSPAFYDLGQREDEVKLNFVSRISDSEGTHVETDFAQIDERMGTLAMIAPRISEMVAQVRQQEQARVEAERLAEENCPRIFVEGESDKIVLERTLALFFPAAVNQVRFETKRDGAGHKYVIDMLIGWRSQHKHHPGGPKAAGVVDGDAASEKTVFNSQGDNVASAKCFMYQAPAALRPALAAGFRIPATLEALYPRQIWQDALQRGHLEARDPLKAFPKDLSRQILLGQADAAATINPLWAIFVEYDFDATRKIATARRICDGNDHVCRENLANFESVLRDALLYLSVIQ